MATVDRLIDSLQLFLTGGSSNKDPDACLGGAISATRLHALGALFSSPIPALRVRDIKPANGEGSAQFLVDSDGNLVFTPPGASAGAPLALAAGETKIISGADTSKAVRVTRESGLIWNGLMTAELEDPLNGAIGMKSVTDSQRSSGATTYRAIAIKNASPYPVVGVRLWCPASSKQSTYSLGVETPVSGVVQTIANETTSPSGITWIAATSLSTALYIPSISPGAWKAVWLKKVFPAAGVVAAREVVDLAMRFGGV